MEHENIVMYSETNYKLDLQYNSFPNGHTLVSTQKAMMLHDHLPLISLSFLPETYTHMCTHTGAPFIRPVNLFTAVGDARRSL